MESAKEELTKPDPSWKIIIGALVVVAALTSGVADASQAFENVNSAINYILKHSDVPHQAPQLRSLPPQDEKVHTLGENLNV